MIIKYKFFAFRTACVSLITCGCCHSNPPIAAPIPRYATTKSVEASTFQLIDFDWLGQFKFDNSKGTTLDVPPNIRSLDGCKIAVDGRMSFLSQPASEVKEFVLTPDGFDWDRARIQRMIIVRSANRKLLFRVEEGIFSVDGVLHVKVESEDGCPLYIFSLDAVSIKKLSDAVDHPKLWRDP